MPKSFRVYSNKLEADYSIHTLSTCSECGYLNPDNAKSRIRLKLVVVLAIVAIAVGGTVAFALSQSPNHTQSVTTNPKSPTPTTPVLHHFTVTVSAISCYYSQDQYGNRVSDWSGTIISDGRVVFDGEGCGTQSWSVSDVNTVSASFTDLGCNCPTVLLNLEIQKDGQTCFTAMESQPGLSLQGSC